MRDSLKLNKLKIKDFLNYCSMELKSIGINSHHLDSELILSHHLGVNRVYLHSHPEEIIPNNIIKALTNSLKERLQHKPIAYIIGYREFYGRLFKVNQDTLIPRPESEMIIETLKKHIDNKSHLTLLDIGTGSGCLGITAKLEVGELEVYLSDISPKALRVAETNAKELKANVHLIESDLLDKINFQPNIILANLPYVDKSWAISPDTKHEPTTALFAEDNGLALIKKLIFQIKNKEIGNCLLILEADPRQHQSIIDIATEQDLELTTREKFCLAFNTV